MTRLLLLILISSQFSCNDISEQNNSLDTKKYDTASIANIIHQVRQQTLFYLDTVLETDSKKLVRFHSQLDSTTYETLQNWITHNQNDVNASEVDVLSQLKLPKVDSNFLAKFDTTLTDFTGKDKTIQVHFNGFSFNHDTTNIATVVGVYFGYESERITGWKEFVIFTRLTR
jgi:hypothetical protein